MDLIKINNIRFDNCEPVSKLLISIKKKASIWLDDKSEHTIKGRLVSLRIFLRHISILTINNNFNPDTKKSHEWENACIHWRNTFIETSLSTGTKKTRITSVNWFLAKAQNEGLIPRFRLIPNIKNGYTSREGGDTFADTVDHRQVIKQFGISQKDIIGLNDIEKRLMINNLIHKEIRDYAIREANKTWNLYIRGKELIKEADIKFEVNHFSQRKSPQNGSKAFIECNDTGLGKLLKLISEFNNGRYPCTKDLEKDSTGLTQYIMTFARKFGVEFVKRHLHLSTDSVIAFATIIAIETRLNISSLEYMNEDLLYEVDTPNHAGIKWLKKRGNKIIKKELPINNPAIISIKRILELRSALINDAQKELKKTLIIYYKNTNGNNSNRIDSLNTERLNILFKRFIHKNNKLNGLNIHPSQIRKSFLEKTYIETNGNIFAVKGEASHSKIATTDSYLRNSTILKIETMKIREAQNNLIIRANSSGSKPVGNGFNCALIDTNKTKCISYDSCFCCNNRVIVATTTSVAYMISFLEHLNRNEILFKYDRPERWINIWLPTKVTLHTAISEIKKYNSNIYRSALKKIESESFIISYPPLT